MFEAWGRALFHRRYLALSIAIVLVALAAAWGSAVFGTLSSSDTFTPPASESQRESDMADRVFGRDESDVVVLYRSQSMVVPDPRYQRAVTSALGGLPRAYVARTTTFWSSGSADLVSADRHATYAVLQLTGADDAARQRSYTAIRDHLGTRRVLTAAGITAKVGGDVPVVAAINAEVKADIAKAEAFSLPVLLILLLVIFGSLAAAALPVVIGGVAILGSFAVLRLLTLTTTVSIYAVNITTILGLGLGIDYALFIVTRFRDELNRQPSVAQAVMRTVATAGRTVAVSGITVAVALTSLILFPETFLRSMGYGGVATVAVDVIAALTVLPALLAVLGHRVNALRIRREVARDSGGWYRLANSVMRRPVLYVTVIVLGLLALGAPFSRISWGGTDARSLPAASTARQVAERLARDFPVNSTAPIEVLVTHATSPAALAGYLRRIGDVPGVTAVRLTARGASAARVDVGYRPATMSPAARHIVTRIRRITPPRPIAGRATAGRAIAGGVLVGGSTAGLADELSSLGATLPWMALAACLSTFVLLFLAFGSVVLPVKAIVMNVLSLSAAAGVIVWIFQWGHLSGPLRFTPTGTIDPTMPILMLAVIYGLSMDYEVFLLSRIREAYDQSRDNTGSVAAGLQRTGGLITSLAVLLIVVVGAFSASGIAFIKLIGIGMIVALVIDASVVRVLLVPATMRLLGQANWWAPRPLRPLYARFGIKEERTGPEAAQDRRTPAATPVTIGPDTAES